MYEVKYVKEKNKKVAEKKRNNANSIGRNDYSIIDIGRDKHSNANRRKWNNKSSAKCKK